MNKKAKLIVTAGKTKVLVLAACRYGVPLDVVALDDADLAVAKEQGLVDDNAAAVAHGESLAVEEAAE